MNTTLAALERTETGKGAGRRLRREGRIPAVLYGPDHEPRSLAVDPDDLAAIFRATRNRNTVVDLQVPGEGSVPVLVREAQRHPVSRDLLHVDFYRMASERFVTVKVPVNPVGTARGMALGGRIRLIRRELWVRCLFTDIPPTLDVNIEALTIDDMISVAELEAPEGVEILFDSDFTVLTLYGRRANLGLLPEDEVDQEDGEEAVDEAEGEDSGTDE